jgi:hypothetical protein
VCLGCAGSAVKVAFRSAADPGAIIYATPITQA